jgi:Predicted permeases
MNNLKKYYLTIVFIGYIVLLSFLLITGKIRNYINPVLSFLTVLTLLILTAMLVNNLLKTDRTHPEHSPDCHCGHHEMLEKSSLLLLLPLLLPLIMPPQTLSYHASMPNMLARLPQLVTVFLSIIIQALPFVLIGVFGSALMHNLVTVEMVENKLAHTGKLPGILLAIGAGFFFPICDCGVIPVARRLLMKKVPPYMAIAFLVTAPLVNPITVWATATAFGYNLPVTLTRVGMAIMVGIIVAFMVSKFFPSIEHLFHQKALQEMETTAATPEAVNHSAHGKSIIRDIFNHANDEFLEVGKFLIIGTLIASTIQTLLPRQFLMVVTKNPALSVLVMMFLALCLSLCAEADAFVARSFLYHFPLGSVMSFMVFGQMIDIKNSALLLKSFKPKAVLCIFGLCALLVLIFCSLLNFFPIYGLIRRRF